MFQSLLKTVYLQPFFNPQPVAHMHNVPWLISRWNNTSVQCNLGRGWCQKYKPTVVLPQSVGHKPPLGSKTEAFPLKGNGLVLGVLTVSQHSVSWASSALLMYLVGTSQLSQRLPWPTRYIKKALGCPWCCNCCHSGGTPSTAQSLTHTPWQILTTVPKPKEDFGNHWPKERG